MLRKIALICLLLAFQASGALTPLTQRHWSAEAVGIVVRDIRGDTDVVSINADRLMTPASILKCLTSAAALTQKGEKWRWLTPVYLRGWTLGDSVFQGDIIIEAHGDPTTESSYFPDRAGLPDSIASRIKRMGISRITGNIRIDCSSFPQGSEGALSRWDKEDLPHAYGAGLFALNYRGNRVYGERSNPSPALTLVRDIKKVLAQQGIALDAQGSSKPHAPRHPVFTRDSAPLPEVLTAMMHHSDNLYAEGVLRSLEPRGDLAQCVDREKKIIADSLQLRPKASLAAYDGSGLTRANLVTPDFMADLLQEMARGSHGRTYSSLFPLAGLEGTVKGFLADTPLQGQIALKSGSMKGVQCFAGYRFDPVTGNPTHVIVIMANGFTPKRRAALRREMESMLLDVFTPQI